MGAYVSHAGPFISLQNFLIETYINELDKKNHNYIYYILKHVHICLFTYQPEKMLSYNSINVDFVIVKPNY